MRLRPRWVGLAAVPLVLALGCGGDDGTADTEAAESSGSGDDGPPLPSFAEPASDRLSLMSTRTEDVSLEVLGIRPGVTELLLDGISQGSLSEGSAVGRLDSNTLELYMRGSMLPRMHQMTMRTADVTGTLESEVINVQISADITRLPVARLDDAPALAGDRVTSFGHGEGMLLLVHEPAASDGPLHLIPLTTDGWDPADLRTVSIPGLAAGPGLEPLPVAALRYARSDDDPGRVRVAWRVGEPGTRIDLLDAPWAEVGPQTSPGASMSAQDALADHPAEHVELSRPWLVGDRLLATLFAPVDVESSRPGDRSLVHARIRVLADGEALAIDRPQRLGVGPDLVDLDHLGPAVDLVAAERGAPAPMSIRADRREPLVLELDPVRDLLRIRPSEVPSSDVDAFDTDIPLATVLGAFGSRTVAGLQASSEGQLELRYFDDLGGTVEARPADPESLPDLAGVTAPPAVGSVEGVTVVLVPFGDAAPVHIVHVVGDSPEVIPLPDLHCDSVALALVSRPGPVPLACARDEQVWLGELTAPSTDERGGG